MRCALRARERFFPTIFTSFCELPMDFRFLATETLFYSSGGGLRRKVSVVRVCVCRLTLNSLSIVSHRRIVSSAPRAVRIVSLVLLRDEKRPCCVAGAHD